MEAKTTPFSFSLAKIFCSVFGHKFKVSNLVTNHIREYKCSHCGEEVTDTANGFLAKLTPRIKETNEFLANFHQRRSRKVFSKVS